MTPNLNTQSNDQSRPWKHKKTDLKSSMLMAVWIFVPCSPNCTKQPRIKYLFYKFLYPMIFGTLSGILLSLSIEVKVIWIHFSNALCLSYICQNISFFVGFFVKSEPQCTMHWFNTIVGFPLISIYLPGTFTCFL